MSTSTVLLILCAAVILFALVGIVALALVAFDKRRDEPAADRANPF